MAKQLRTPQSTKRKAAVIAVFCSGSGSNFQALAEAVKAKKLRASIALMITDNPEAKALQRAKRLGVESLVIERAQYATRKEYEQALIEACAARNVKWICLAGYMRILSTHFVSNYANRIINVHPSLLPAFPGAHAAKDALRWGAKVTGVTIHVVDEAIDNGPILAQEAVPILPGDTEERLLTRIHKVEHRLYPQTLQRLFQGKIQIQPRK